MKTAEQIALIERYLRGEMNSIERHEFRIQIALDPEMDRMVRAYKTVEKAFEEDRRAELAEMPDIRSHVLSMSMAAGVHERTGSPKLSPPIPINLLVAIIALSLATVAAFFWMRPGSAPPAPAAIQTSQPVPISSPLLPSSEHPSTGAVPTKENESDVISQHDSPNRASARNGEKRNGGMNGAAVTDTMSRHEKEEAPQVRLSIDGSKSSQDTVVDRTSRIQRSDTNQIPVQLNINSLRKRP